MATRRHFLQTLMAAFAGSALIHKVAPAEINPSWLTAKPLPPSTDMALDWWSQVADEALRILEGELRCVKIVSPLASNMRHGDSVRLREPARLNLNPMADFSGDIHSLILETTHPVLLDRVSYVDLALDESDASLSLEQFSARRIQPAMCSLASHIFDASRGAELIVTAQQRLPERDQMRPATSLASSAKLNLRASHLHDPFNPPERIIHFDMLWGALRPT